MPNSTSHGQSDEKYVPETWSEASLPLQAVWDFMIGKASMISMCTVCSHRVFYCVATSEGWLLRHLKAGTLASCQLPSLVPSLPPSLKYLLRWMTRRIHSLCFSMNLPELKNHPVALTFWFQWHREKLQQKTCHDSAWQIGGSRPSRKSSWEILWTFCAV